jgi:hypothetical protein
VKEHQVDVEVLAPNFDVHLAPHEREADPKLEEKVAHVLEQPALEVPLLRVGCPGFRRLRFFKPPRGSCGAARRSRGAP